MAEQKKPKVSVTIQLPEDQLALVDAATQGKLSRAAVIRLAINQSKDFLKLLAK